MCMQHMCHLIIWSSVPTNECSCTCCAMITQYEERERCGRTVYVANVDERLEATDVRRFFSKFLWSVHACSLRYVGTLPLS